jgi:hypothetical protein
VARVRLTANVSECIRRLPTEARRKKEFGRAEKGTRIRRLTIVCGRLRLEGRRDLIEECGRSPGRESDHRPEARAEISTGKTTGSHRRSAVGAAAADSECGAGVDRAGAERKLRRLVSFGVRAA